MRFVKKDAPPELVEAIRRIEERADGCYDSLTLLKLHANVSVWGLLVAGIRMMNQEVAHRGENTAAHSAKLLNVSRFLPVAIKWAIKHGKPTSKLAARRWTTRLAAKVDEALDVAYQYADFEICFPLWHRGRYLAELISPGCVRFTAPGAGRHRQVSAFQKGIRPREGRFRGRRPQQVAQTPRLRALFTSALQVSRKTGNLRFEYDDPWNLWRELFPEYQARVTAAARRVHSLSLGDFTLGDFNDFYAAFLAVCAAHDFLCFEWGSGQSAYPLDSAVMVRSKQRWGEMLSDLSGIPQSKCERIIGDLTFDFVRSLDLHVHPFVPLDSAKTRLAVAPQFPLHSRLDENILRVCSILRPSAFDATTLEKEQEMLADLGKRCTYALRTRPANPWGQRAVRGRRRIGNNDGTA